MIVLEANKVYKAVHERKFFGGDFPRDYIIFSLKDEYIIAESSIGKKDVPWLSKVVQIECLFSVDFYGEAAMGHTTSIFTDCHFEALNANDINDVKKAIDGCAVNGYKYNRKLNKLIQIKNDTES